MTTQSYRVGEGANLKLYPRGTKVGDVVELTEAQALYELDMGRLEVVAAGAPTDPEGATDAASKARRGR